MSGTGAPNLGKRQLSESEHAQKVPDMDASQQLKLRERQRFFEEVLQHDVDVYLSTSHLQIDNRKPPMGSISSMEVNVDLLEQMDLMDISDHEALDVFLNSGSDTGPLASPLPEVCDEDEEDDDDEDENELVYKDGVGPQGSIRRRPGSKNRGSSGSTGSTDQESQDTSESGSDTPVIQSDEEEVQVDTFLFSSTSSGKEEEDEEEEEEEKNEG